MIRSVMYTRRKGVVRGPYTADQITRYLLLGRIMFSDEISEDCTSWSPVVEFAALLPGTDIVPDGMPDSEQLMLARQQIDERRRERRSIQAHRPPAGHLERRAGQERRRKQDESGGISAGIRPGRQPEVPLLRPLLLGLLLAVLILAWMVPVSR